MAIMQGICSEACPIEDFRQTLPEGTAEASSTFHWSLIPLCGAMERALNGVNGTLTDTRINRIAEEVTARPGSETDFILQNTGIVQAVHDCVVKMNAGECSLPEHLQSGVRG